MYLISFVVLSARYDPATSLFSPKIYNETFLKLIFPVINTRVEKSKISPNLDTTQLVRKIQS